MAAPQEWRRVNPPPINTCSAFAAYEESGRMPEAMFGQHKSSSSSRQQPRRHRRRGAPGPLACSRSSDEIHQRTGANVALSPVTGPGATSFSSVASAFDFQHHVGSDPASELLVLKHILTRECLLSRLEAVCDLLRKRFQLLAAAATATSHSATAGLGEGVEGIVDLLSKMRAATVAVIEAISVWRKDMTGHPPSAFVWHGDNYLLKITNDLNFLAGVQPLVNTLKMHPARFCRNPLMLPQTLDEQRRDGELYEDLGVDNNVSSGAGRRRHLYQAAQVLLDEESLESERDLLRQASTKCIGALPDRGDTSPEFGTRHGFGAGGSGSGYGVRSCPTGPREASSSQGIDSGPASYSSSQLARGAGQAEDDDALRRQQPLSTWYEEARSQLVSLSTSPADEEYFLRSRRFWSKEELGDTGNGCSPPPPHRRQPGTLTRGGGKHSALATDAAVTGREATDGEGSDRADLFSERLPSSCHQKGLPPPRRARRSHGAPRSNGQETPTAGGSARQTQGGDGERGGADVWSRPDRFGGGNSAALSCLTVDDVEQVLREVDPLPATVAVCAAVVFLLSPEDQPPADFLWPQGFEAVALPVEDFLWRLHEASGTTASSTKARFLQPVLQREHLLPEVIELQGAHAVACLCAWALEELQVCEEFAEWGEAALEPWYETQLAPTLPDAPESNEVVGCEVRLIYKALHMLPHVGGSYVISLFEDKGGGGGFIVRAFDRAKRDSFWLSLTKNKIASFGENATRSPATLASTLARELKLKIDGTGKARLVLPPAKKIEPSKAKSTTSTGAVKSSDDVDGQAVNEPAPTAVPEGPAAQANPRPQRRSHPPPMRGSKVEDLGPLVENEGDVSDCSAGELRHTRPLPGTGDSEDAAVVADRRAVEKPEKDRASEEISVKTEKAATASELTRERQGQHVSQATNASDPALALSEPCSEPRATTTSGEAEGNGLQEGLWEAGMEESGSYGEDFAPDNDEDKGTGLGGEAEARVEESGSYADDFADDADEPHEQDSNEDDRGESKQGVENQEAADEAAASSGVAIAAGSAEAFSMVGSADSPVSKSAVGVQSSVDRRSDDLPQEIQTPRTSKAAAASGPSTEPHQSCKEGGSAEVDLTAERAVETELEEGYDDDEFLEESAEQREFAEVEDEEATQPDVSTNMENSRSPPTEEVSAEDGGASTSRALQSQESEDLAGEGAKPAQQPQPDDDGWRRSSGETANNRTVLDQTITDESNGCGKVDVESVAQVLEHEIGQESPGGLLAQDNENTVQVSLLQPMPTLIVVDALGNTGSSFAHEGSAHEDSFETSTASKLAASKLASAAVAAAMGSALELMSKRNEVDFTDVEAHDAPVTEVVQAESFAQERACSAGVATTAVTTPNPLPTERAQLTDRTPDDCFEGSFEDDEDEIDAVKSAGNGPTVASCSEFSSFAGEIDVSPSLSEQDTNEGPGPGSLVGDQAEAEDGEAVEPASAAEKAVHESSTTEYEDFEEEFDEEFEEDMEEDMPSDRPKEERQIVGSGSVADGSEKLSGSEALDTRERMSTATTAGAGGEQPVEIPPSVEEVIGNQDEDRKGSEGRRNSVGVDQVSPVGGLSGDEVEDDFDEDDFEDP